MTRPPGVYVCVLPPHWLTAPPTHSLITQGPSVSQWRMVKAGAWCALWGSGRLRDNHYLMDRYVYRSSLSHPFFPRPPSTLHGPHLHGPCASTVHTNSFPVRRPHHPDPVPLPPAGRSVDGSCVDGRPSTLARTSDRGSNRSDMVFAGPLINHPNADLDLDLDPGAMSVVSDSDLRSNSTSLPTTSQGRIPNVIFYHTVLDVPHAVHIEMQRGLPPLEEAAASRDHQMPTETVNPATGSSSADCLSDLDLDLSDLLDPSEALSCCDTEVPCGGVVGGGCVRQCVTLLVALRDLGPGEELFVGE